VSRLPSLTTTTAAIMVALAMSALPAAAQGGGGGMGGGGDRGARMHAALFQGITLNDTQQKKVDSIEASYKASRSGMTMGPGMSADDRQKMRDSMRQEAADYRTVLTPDQQSQFDQNLANMRSQMRNRGGAGGGGGTTPQ
jgi:Spy/CpxP family protein refolding chaperone